MWASSGEMHATAHLLQSRIGCFAANPESGANEWSWYPSRNHYLDAPIILLYNINKDHFLLVQRVKTNIFVSFVVLIISASFVICLTKKVSLFCLLLSFKATVLTRQGN